MVSIERIRQIINGQSIPILTPCYLFDELIIEENFKMLHSLLGESDCKFSIAYSIKTNPLDIILSKLKDIGGWAEVTSKREIQLAEKHEFPKILFNGIYKSDEEMEYAARVGALIILDGIQQISKIQKLATKNKELINVGIRISSSPILNDNGIRFGVYANDTELIQIAKDLTSHGNIDLCCLHMHLGTNISDPELYRLSLQKLYYVSNLIKCCKIDIRFFDIGGGMPSFINSKWKRIFQNGICSFTNLVSDANKTIIIEPGRCLVENAGFLITKVVDLRKQINMEGEDVIVDVGTNSIMGESTFQIVHGCYELKPDNNKEIRNYRLVGSLCSSEDIILNKFSGGSLEINDLILISNVGAYDFSTAYQFSRNSPPIYVLTKSNQLKYIRD